MYTKLSSSSSARVNPLLNIGFPNGMTVSWMIDSKEVLNEDPSVAPTLIQGHGHLIIGQCKSDMESFPHN